MGVKTYTKERFCKIEKGKSIKFLPAVLSIYADLVDIHNSESNTKECRADIVRCPIKSNCNEYKNCNCTLRQVYIYNEEHKLIFREPQNLPSNILINNTRLNIIDNKNLKNHEKNLEIIIGEVILKHYSNIQWIKYCCSIDNYVDILASLFFFCPDILWCALENEMRNDQIDYNVMRAINRCLDIFTLFDQMIRKHKGEMYEYKDKAILIINNECQINEITQIVIQQNIKNLNPIDRAGIIARLATDNFQILCDHISTQSWEKKKIKKNLGRTNYKCIVNCCKTLPCIG